MNPYPVQHPTGDPFFSCEVVTSGAEAAAIRVGGELDLDTCLRLRSHASDLVEAGHCHLHLDLSPLTFCDSSGLSTLLYLRNLTRGRGGTLRLSGIRPAVRHTFEISGVAAALADPTQV